MKKQDSLYMQVYDYYRNLIESGKIHNGEKIPSIRRSASELGVSKTTIEQAYMCLCDDGYLVPRKQSGYYVSGRAEQKKSDSSKRQKSTENKLIYDFASSGVDSESFDLSLWRRYVKSALRQTERLLSYGEPQGETELREEIALFAKQNRNCVCDASNIIIGAGVQSLLHILCPLINERKSIAFSDPNYIQGVSVFKDHGFKISNTFDRADIIYTSPSRKTRWGETISVTERFRLAEYAAAENKLIIEDDYGSEFRYVNKPTPSLQGLSGGKNTVYLGTFSKLLLPSIRISYMILPSELNEKYREVSSVYNQTVSKADQIALCSFIRDGHLSAQIRKSRKLYLQKSKILCDLLTENFEDKVTIGKTDSPLFVKALFKTDISLPLLLNKCEKEGISFIPIAEKTGEVEIAFSVSAISTEKIERGVILLKKLTSDSE